MIMIGRLENISVHYLHPYLRNKLDVKTISGGNGRGRKESIFTTYPLRAKV